VDEVDFKKADSGILEMSWDKYLQRESP